MSAGLHHPEARFASPQALVEHYKGVYRRTYSAGARFAERQRAQIEKRQAEALAVAIEASKTALDRQIEEAARTDQARGPSSKRSALRIIGEVAARSGVRADRIMSRDKTNAACVARWEAMWLIRKALPHKTLDWIGGLFDRDRATVIHGVRRWEERS